MEMEPNTFCNVGALFEIYHSETLFPGYALRWLYLQGEKIVLKVWLITGVFEGKKIQNFIDEDKHYFQGLWRAENLKLYFHGTNNWFYLQDWMFVDYSLEKLFGGSIFDEM